MYSCRDVSAQPLRLKQGQLPGQKLEIRSAGWGGGAAIESLNPTVLFWHLLWFFLLRSIS